ncbi:MAG: glycosyltransferase family 9 protein [Planctomycetia bacterium]
MSLALAKRLDRRMGAAWAAWLGAWDALCEGLRPPDPVEHVRHVLVVKLWGVGNWALLRPVVRDLRERHAGARLTVLTLAGNLPLVRDLADEVLVVRPAPLLGSALDLARAAWRLRRDPPSLALDFEPFAHAGALVARLGRSAQRLGFAHPGRARERLYTVRVPLRGDAHAARSFRDLAEAAGVAPAPYVPGHLAPTAAGEAEVRALGLPAGESLALLHPGSGDNFPGRRWSEQGFAALGRALRAEGLAVAVTGDASEAGLCARVAQASGPGAASLAGRLTLEGLVALVGRARLLASNDTGPVHLASALGVPTLALYGPNTPVLYGPLAPGSRAFYRALPCSPCLTADSHRSSRCRIFTCMASIPVGEVLEAARRLARRAPHGAVPGTQA